jgi:hypothetical protein
LILGLFEGTAGIHGFHQKLAVKYNKDLDLIENIVDIYLTDTDFGYRQIKSTIKEKSKGETKN